MSVSKTGFSHSLAQIKAYNQTLNAMEKEMKTLNAQKKEMQPETPFHEFGLKELGSSSQQENKASITDLQSQYNDLLKEMDNPSKNFKLLG